MDLDRLWKNTQEELKIVISPAYYSIVTKTQLVTYQSNHAVISCPSPFLLEQIQKRFLAVFKEAFDNQTKVSNTIEYVVQEPIKSLDDSLTPTPLFSYSPPHQATVSHLHPKYTFNNLIVGNSNNFAFAAAQGIVKNPGLSYNPFFIWGGVGVGKTHLMQAIGHELLKNNSSLKIRYFPAETFGNELIASLKSKSINQFKDKYRLLDCILVDDIQFIAGKEYIQEEFFHTFNALHMAGKQVILTSDRKPSDIKDLEDRLVSRFMGGLTVDIQPPDFEMRSAIILQKAAEKGIAIASDAVDYLAEHIESNTRDIEGKVQELAVLSYAKKLNTITLELAEGYFQGQSGSSQNFNQNQNNKPTPRHIISVCAKHFNIKTSELCGNSRKKELVTARHITAYFLLNEINLPLKEVGHLLGGRDHTSIMHARDKVHTDLSTNPHLKSLINQIKSSF